MSARNGGRPRAASGSTPAPQPSAATATAFAQCLLDWFDRHGRHDLPWQLDATPYRVWVSEIMLQQTQVAVVVPYFERFMARFPDLPTLAGAEPDDVLQLWSGLGYYARARNLHRAARLIVTEHQGRFPERIEVLESLPGIGRSTAGAILSLALGQHHPILDGNCKRVLARYFVIPGWTGSSAVLAQLWALAETLTPVHRVADFNQAMMDLGATLCKRSRPACPTCPLEADCQARLQDRAHELPAPKPRKQIPQRAAQVLLIRDPRGQVFLERRPPVGIWGGLWAPPQLRLDSDVRDWCLGRLGVSALRLEMLPPRRHTFSHFQLEIRPVLVDLLSTRGGIGDDPDAIWVDPARSDALGLPAPIRRMLDELEAVPAPAGADNERDDRSSPMSRMVNCVKLGREAEGLDRAPYPGELGQRIFEHVSKPAWADWLKHQTMLINENRLSPMDPKARKFLEEQMEKYFFGEGAVMPEGYVPPKE